MTEGREGAAKRTWFFYLSRESTRWGLNGVALEILPTL